MKIPNADSSAFRDGKAGTRQQGDDVAETDVTVAMKMAQQTLLALRRWPEVHHEHATTRLEYPANFTGAILARLPRQVMQHERAQHGVETRVRVGQRFDDARAERHLYAPSRCLGRSAFDHRW